MHYFDFIFRSFISFCKISISFLSMKSSWSLSLLSLTRLSMQGIKSRGVFPRSTQVVEGDAAKAWDVIRFKSRIIIMDHIGHFAEEV